MDKTYDFFALKESKMAKSRTHGLSGRAESRLCLLLGLVMSLVSNLDGQKRPLKTDDIESWRRITEKVISPDGRWIAYKTEPWKGDSRIFLYSRKGEQKFSYDGGTNIRITDDSEFMIFAVMPADKSVRELNPRKNQKADLPSELLGIYAIRSGKLDLIKNFRNYRIPEKWAGWLAYQVESPAGDAGGGKHEENKRKKETEKNGYRLNLRDLESGVVCSWPFVTEYFFAEKAKKLVFITTGDEEEWTAGIYMYELGTEGARPLITGQNDYRQVAASENGDKLAFLLKPDGDGAAGDFSLYYWDGQGRAREIANNRCQGMPEKWRISENGGISYSNDGKGIFFGIAPLRPDRDADVPDDEFPGVDIWHGGEGVLHSVQLVNRDHELKRAYQAVHHLDDQALIPIETEDMPQSRFLRRGKADMFLLHSSKPYERQSMWDRLHYDAYLLDLTTGERRIIKKDIGTRIQASPGGQYLVWYNYGDSSYYTYHLESGKEYRITEPATLRAEIETNTTFDQNEPYGSPGWLEDDRAVLIYDRYDIWKVDPENRHGPKNLTVSGRKDKIVYRLINFPEAGGSIAEEEIQILLGTNETSRSSGYYKWDLKRSPEPERLIGGDYRLSLPIKAEDSDTIVYTKETFHTFPDLFVSDLKFRESVRISEANPRQSDFLWGTAEVYEWTSLDGRKLEGLLYKPEGF
ncbi:MAG: hypothetical protein FJY82_15440, partial [Candidatus Aminicenantes bacterium]|nr:hypothetical protein [Candidatus Aminicenantes bacterium]